MSSIAEPELGPNTILTKNSTVMRDQWKYKEGKHGDMTNYNWWVNNQSSSKGVLKSPKFLTQTVGKGQTIPAGIF